MLGLILVKLLVINPMLPNNLAKPTQLHYQTTWLMPSLTGQAAMLGLVLVR